MKSKQQTQTGALAVEEFNPLDALLDKPHTLLELPKPNPNAKRYRAVGVINRYEYDLVEVSVVCAGCPCGKEWGKGACVKSHRKVKLQRKRKLVAVATKIQLG